MYYDAVTLAAVKDELARVLIGGRVQRIVQPARLALGFEIYAGQRHQLWLSAETQTPGVLLMDAKLRRGMESPSPLQLRLLKCVRDARLEAIAQPDLERVLRLTFLGEFGPVDLICEIMGRYSNIILLGPDGIVMEALKHVPASMNRVRVTLPGQPYVPPPAQAKDHPLHVSVEQLSILLGQQTESTLAQRLVNGLTGISPILAREIVYRATGELDPPPNLGESACATLLKTMQDLLSLPETHAWSPCLAFEGAEAPQRPIAYAPYELTHLPQRAFVSSISGAISRVWEARRSFDAYQTARDRLRAFIDKQVTRQHTRLAALQRSLVPEAQIEALKTRANAILALAWTIKPGQRELVADPAQLGDAEGEALRIALDPTLSPADNAQKLFREYRKMQAAGAQVPELIHAVEEELEYLAQLRTEIDIAEDRVQLDEVEREMRAANYIEANGSSAKLTNRSRPLSVHAPDGTLILVGRNSQQNQEVTFRRSAPDDLWLHAHGVPGAHVLIKSGGGSVDEQTLLIAARLAAHYSAARGEGKVQVDCTAKRHVRAIKDAHPGMVNYTHEQTLVIVPEEE